MIRGRVWKLGHDLNTDNIIPGRYKFRSRHLRDLLQYVLIDVRPEFHKEVRVGDLIVAGKNFGYGSSREHAPRLLKMSGISAVIAKSFARIFFRNAINVGLPVIEAPDVYETTQDGDIIEVDITSGIIKNLTRGLTYTFRPYPEILMRLIREGGIIEYYRRRGVFPWEENIE